MTSDNEFFSANYNVLLSYFTFMKNMRILLTYFIMGMYVRNNNDDVE